jgi:hypothetical protein
MRFAKAADLEAELRIKAARAPVESVVDKQSQAAVIFVDLATAGLLRLLQVLN